MDHLDSISVDELQRALENVEGKKPTQRLLAAIAYKNGVTQTELAEWYGVERRTIYSWLTRLEAGSLERAVEDAHRSGRPRKLSEADRSRFERTLRESPAEIGYDARSWTPSLVRTHLRETYDVDYSLPSCRRLMKEAGLSFRRTPRTATEADSSDRDERERGGGRWTFSSTG